MNEVLAGLDFAFVYIDVLQKKTSKTPKDNILTAYLSNRENAHLLGHEISNLGTII